MGLPKPTLRSCQGAGLSVMKSRYNVYQDKTYNDRLYDLKYLAKAGQLYIPGLPKII